MNFDMDLVWFALGGLTVFVLIMLYAALALASKEDDWMEAMIRTPNCLRCKNGHNVTVECQHYGVTVRVKKLAKDEEGRPKCPGYKYKAGS